MLGQPSFFSLKDRPAHASPLLLWTEFTTYIKGSFASLDDPEVAHIATWTAMVGRNLSATLQLVLGGKHHVPWGVCGGRFGVVDNGGCESRGHFVHPNKIEVCVCASLPSRHRRPRPQSAYYGLGSKQAIALQDRREAVWQLYELYEKAKRSMNGFDLPDVVHHVYHELQRRPLRRSFDFLYLDEVQEEGVAAPPVSREGKLSSSNVPREAIHVPGIYLFLFLSRAALLLTDGQHLFGYLKDCETLKLLRKVRTPPPPRAWKRSWAWQAGTTQARPPADLTQAEARLFFAVCSNHPCTKSLRWIGWACF